MLIQTFSLTKTYKVNGIKTPALTEVNLGVEEGDFLAVAGPSGSGKTSLLNIIGALDTPTSGSVLFEGKDVFSLRPYQLSEMRLRKLGFVFQAYNLINTLTAFENVEYIMYLQGIAARTRRIKTEDILNRVGLRRYAGRFPNQLSGGQQQRVAVARAIVSEPGVVLADEPTANLDSKTGESLMELMRGLNEEKGITFIFSTHDNMVMEKSKRLIRLKDGEVLE